MIYECHNPFGAEIKHTEKTGRCFAPRENLKERFQSKSEILSTDAGRFI